MAFTKKYLERVAEGKRDSVRDWLLDVPMPWPEKEKEPLHFCTPLHDSDRPPTYLRGRRTGVRRQVE